jgi:hypothetical protein
LYLRQIYQIILIVSTEWSYGRKAQFQSRTLTALPNFFPVKLLHDYRFSFYREWTLKFFERISFWFASIQYNIVVMPQLRQPASDPSSRRPHFDSMSIHGGSVTKKLALWQVFSEYFSFPCQCHSTNPACSSIHLGLSSTLCRVCLIN